MTRVSLVLLVLGIVGICGCGGSSGSSAPAPGPSEPLALVVGSASGPAYQAIAQKYRTVQGTGSEDPQNYSLILFDGNTTTPQQLNANPGTSNFLNSGKMLVVVNATTAHRELGLKGIVWVRPLGSSPAVTIFKNYDANGVSQGHAAVEFPIVIFPPLQRPGQISELESTGAVSQTSSDESVNQAGELATSGRQVAYSSLPAQAMDQLAKSWVNTFTARYLASRAAANLASASQFVESEIAGTSIGDGQTVKGFDYIQPVSMTINSQLNQPSTIVTPDPFWSDTTNPPGVSCANLDEYNGMAGGACSVNTGTAIDYSVTPGGDVETHLYALLTTTGQQVIVARQTANIGPSSNPTSAQVGCFSVLWRVGAYPISCWGPEAGIDSYNLNSLLGFNLDVNSTLSWPDALARDLLVSEFTPQAANNVTTLSTSTTQSYQVSVSASAGIEDGKPAASLSAGFSYGWSWTQGTSVNLSDWTEDTHQPNSNSINFDYYASDNTPDTYTAVQLGEKQTNPTGNPALTLTGPLTQLQSSAMSMGSETVLKTANTPLSNVVTLTSTFNFNFGEVYNDFNQANSGIIPDYNRVLTFGAVDNYPLALPMEVDFSSPTLQPPQLAPWQLSISPPQLSSGSFASQGSIVLNSPASTPTTINLTYAIIGPNQVTTVPQECPPNSSAFIPSPSVVSGLPQSVTIPAGATKANFTINFAPQGASNPYNVQIVSWQATQNLQYGVCVSVPGAQT